MFQNKCKLLKISIKRLICKMSRSVAIPTTVRGMKTLDKDAFQVKLAVPAVKYPFRSIVKVRQNVHPFEFPKLRGFKNVQPISDTEQIVLLDPDKFSKDIQAVLSEKFTEEGLEFQFVEEEVTIGFGNWDYWEMVGAILPENAQRVRKYSHIGHILHLNLRPEEGHEGYEKVIGEILLNSIKNCRTVVNKAENIDNTYRNLPLQLLAGEPEFKAEARESGCRFKLDLQTVFWNPRLQAEHKRVIDGYLTGPDKVVYDICAGIGPFAIPAAKSGATVFANDLNPDCVAFLEENAKLNKVALERIDNMDAREYLLQVVAPDWASRQEGTDGQVLMNLPAMAIDFLPSFKGLLPGGNCGNLTVHCYTFCHGQEDLAAEMAKEKAKEQLPQEELEFLEVFRVRDVAPYKYMVRISLLLKPDLLCSEEPERKKAKCES